MDKETALYCPCENLEANLDKYFNKILKLLNELDGAEGFVLNLVYHITI